MQLEALLAKYAVEGRDWWHGCRDSGNHGWVAVGLRGACSYLQDMLQSVTDEGCCAFALQGVLAALEHRSIDLEILKPVLGFPGYTVSARGSVYGKRSRKLKPYGELYKALKLCRPDKSRKNVLVHRLVCITYLDKSQSFPECDHKNGDPSNNRLTNLRPATRMM